MSHLRIKHAISASFTTEIHALKPGNVSIYSPGHGMSCADFIYSAKLCTPILADRDLPFSRRILDSAKKIRAQVGCNTNLGMLLLFAPIIQAAEYCQTITLAQLQRSITTVLESADQADTDTVFAAIRIANPAGLGQSRQHDVFAKADCSLVEAMCAAQKRDCIALQYCNHFNDIFTQGYPAIQRFADQWGNIEWAAVACYFVYLTMFADSHIVRKQGKQTAARIKAQAKPILQRLNTTDDPEQIRHELLDYDRKLKEEKINPGTSADLTAASLLLYYLLQDS